MFSPAAIIRLILAVSILPSAAAAGDVAVLEKCVVDGGTGVTAVQWKSGRKTGTVSKDAVISDNGHPSVSCDLSTAEFYPAQVALMVKFKEGEEIVGAPDVQVIEMARTSGSSRTYAADIPVAGAAAMTPRDGKYDLSILVGDHRMPKGLQQSLGTVPFVFHQAAKEALSKSGIPESSDTHVATKMAGRYLPLPLIAHTFKPPQKTPPVAITAVFVALTTVIPLLTFLRGLGLLKVNTKLWKIDLHGIVFFGTLAAYLAVLGMFFLFLNLVQTMALCLLLLPVAVISGNKVLCQSRA
ncbi:hypothetical protein FOZ60_000550 [Perkinsus olseni]|uniref:Ribophorin II C-terminal domain-containing protein n=1 Tax=Perkinsus olseni TaxID=32597 RepID=A0A7J6P3A4_PEROL|nr:hypothetical protein FOZ60_000550 [Perkinsus olseni]